MEILSGRKRYIGAADKNLQVSVDLTRQANIFKQDAHTKLINQLEWFNKERNLSDRYLLYGKLEILCDDELFFNDFEDNYGFSVGYCDTLIPVEADLINVARIDEGSIVISNRVEGEELYEGDVVGLYKDGKIEITKILSISNYNQYEQKIELDIIRALTTQYKLIPPVCKYQRIFKPIYQANFLKVYESAYSTNIFGDKIYQFNTFKDIRTNGLLNNLGLPIEELYIRLDLMSGSMKTAENLIDVVEYDLNNLNHTLIDEVDHIFTLGYDDFKYKPYKPFKIRQFSNALVSTSDEHVFELPDYGFKFFDGTVHFRRLLNIGEIEGTEGLDYPFMNNLHYVYEDLKFFIRGVIPKAVYEYDEEELEYDQDIIGDTNNERLC